MPGSTVEMEPVETVSLKKLCHNSMKRALDFFSPTHGQIPPPDPESKRIRMSCRINAEYQGIKSLGELLRQVNAVVKDSGQQSSQPTSVLALPGPNGSSDLPNNGAQNALTAGPSLQPKGLNDVGPSGKSTAVISASGSSDRFEILSAYRWLIECKFIERLTKSHTSTPPCVEKINLDCIVL